MQITKGFFCEEYWSDSILSQKVDLDFKNDRIITEKILNIS